MCRQLRQQPASLGSAFISVERREEVRATLFESDIAQIFSANAAATLPSSFADSINIEGYVPVSGTELRMSISFPSQDFTQYRDTLGKFNGIRSAAMSQWTVKMANMTASATVSMSIDSCTAQQRVALLTQPLGSGGVTIVGTATSMRLVRGSLAAVNAIWSALQVDLANVFCVVKRDLVVTALSIDETGILRATYTINVAANWKTRRRLDPAPPRRVDLLDGRPTWPLWLRRTQYRTFP